MSAVRLRILADVEDRNPRDSVKVHLTADLSDGRSLLVLDDRGFTSSAALDGMQVGYVTDTARVVAGPDGPARGETHEQMRAIYWEMLATKLRVVGVVTDAAELASLPQEVELSARLRHRLRA